MLFDAFCTLYFPTSHHPKDPEVALPEEGEEGKEKIKLLNNEYNQVGREGKSQFLIADERLGPRS